MRTLSIDTRKSLIQNDLKIEESEEKQNPQKESITDGNLEQSSKGEPGSIHNGEHTEYLKIDNKYSETHTDERRDIEEV